MGKVSLYSLGYPGTQPPKRFTGMHLWGSLKCCGMRWFKIGNWKHGLVVPATNCSSQKAETWGSQVPDRKEQCGKAMSGDKSKNVNPNLSENTWRGSGWRAADWFSHEMAEGCYQTGLGRLPPQRQFVPLLACSFVCVCVCCFVFCDRVSLCSSGLLFDF